MREQRIWAILYATNRISSNCTRQKEDFRVVACFLTLKQLDTVMGRKFAIQGYKDACAEEIMERKLLGKKKLEL